MKTLIIAKRIITQLKGDKRFLVLSLVAPLIIMYFLKLLFDALVEETTIELPLIGAVQIFKITNARFMMPAAAFIVHFLSFILCAILLVQERTKGTLERMLIGGFKKTSIILGYTIGYFGLATIQALAVVAESIWLFEVKADSQTIFILFLVIWLLAIVSVMLGIFVSTFARHEGHVFPFIPLIILPSVFLTGIVIDADKLPKWAEYLGYIFPIRYADNIIEIINTEGYKTGDVLPDFAILIGYALALIFVASATLKETE